MWYYALKRENDGIAHNLFKPKTNVKINNDLPKRIRRLDFI
jgi:hypothetical protein